MPFLLPHLSRRGFLAGSLALGAAATLRGEERPLAPVDRDYIALLSDTHIDADPKLVKNGAPLADRLRQAVAEIVAGEQRPAAAIVCGDLAVTRGLAKDYATLLSLIEPLRRAEIDVYLMLGNHDDRDVFWEECRTDGRRSGAMARQVATIVLTHHNLRHPQKPTGLIDTDTFWPLLAERRQVKGHIFGHTHTWKLTERDGVHEINLPPTAYVFSKGMPSGWVAWRLTEKGCEMTLHSSDREHPQHGEQIKLAWRA